MLFLRRKSERCLQNIPQKTKKIWLHKMISNCFCCCFGFCMRAKTSLKLIRYALWFVCAINNRLGKSFITNLLTKFIFNFPPACLFRRFLLSLANLLTSQSICSIIYIHSCKLLASVSFQCWPIYQKLVLDDYESMGKICFDTKVIVAFVPLELIMDGRIEYQL